MSALNKIFPAPVLRIQELLSPSEVERATELAIKAREERGGPPVGLSARQAWARMKARYAGLNVAIKPRRQASA